MRRKLICSGLLEKHDQMDLNEGGAVQAPGDFCVFSPLMSSNTLNIQLGLGCLARKKCKQDGVSRMVGQGEGGCWQHLCRSDMETTDSCMILEVCSHRCATQNTLSKSMGQGGCPWTLDSSMKVPPRGKSQWCLCSTKPRRALLGSTLDGS